MSTSNLRPVSDLADFVARARAVLKSEPSFVEDYFDAPFDYIVEITSYLRSYAAGGGEPQLLLDYFMNCLRESEVKRFDSR